MLRRAVLILAILLIPVCPALTQETSGGFTGGSIKIGYDNRTCDSTLGGSIRYNSATACPEYCNGTAWTCRGCPSSGLVGQWNLDDGSGTTAVESVAARNGTLTNGPTWTTGKLNGAVNFDGTNDFIDITYNAVFDLTGDLTLAAWINATTTASLRRIVTQPSNASGGGEQYSLALNAGTLQLWIGGNYGSGGSDSFLSTSYTATGSWHHVVGTVSGTVTKVYIDGALMNTGSTNPPRSSHSSGNPQIGRFSASFPQQFSGKIDDVRIYNRALTAAEIAVLYSGGAGCE